MKLLTIFFIVISATAFAGPLQEIKTQAQFESYLIESQFNGVLLVAQKDKILFKRAFGVKDFITNTPINTDDKFQIGSVSKQFIAVAILKLQEEKKLSIDDEIVKFLPDLISLKGIRIKDVLNHTSGVANYTDQKKFWELVDFNRTFKFEDILNFVVKLPLDFSPTTKWNYSNSGYIIAGKIVEVVSGQSWDQYIKINFLDPLQMNNTGYSEYFSKVSDIIGYSELNGKLVPVPEFNMSWALSAGALYSTLDDLLKWTDIYEASTLLSEDSKLQMQTPFLKNYALGLSILKFNNEIKISHGGRTPGFTTNLAYLKTSKLKVVKFDNTDGGIADAAEIALNFYAKGSTTALKVKPYEINKNVFAEYVGNYVGSRLNFNVFIKDEVLFLQPNDGQPAYPLVANDQDSFRLMGIAGEEFIRDSSGLVVGLKHYQSGEISEFTKDKGASTVPNKFSAQKLSLDILGF